MPDERLVELERSQRALDRRITAIENSVAFRFFRAAGRPILDWKAKTEYAFRYRLPENPVGQWLEHRDADLYRQWLTKTAKTAARQTTSGPLFTILLNTAEAAAIDAVRKQTWPHWELLIPPAVGAGEYIGVLDPGVLLAPHALSEIAEALAREDVEPDLIYSDSDQLDHTGRPEKPIFRPGWSPDLAGSPLYPGAFYLKRRGTTGNCGLHIPRVLYHARPAAPTGAKPRAPRRAEGNPLASIIVCSRTPRLLAQCLRAIAAKTAWAHREIVVVQHLAGDHAGLEDVALENVARSAGAVHVPFAGSFNFALMSNVGAHAAHGEILIFLNDDVQPLAPLWLESLIAQVQRSGVGIAGARLLYPSGLIQHAGIALGIGDGCGHPGRNTRGSAWFPWLDQTRDVSAVTGACLAMRKSVFEELGGFDPSFPVNYNDVDLCLRAREAGYRVIYESAAVLRHEECQTRRPGTDFDERLLFFRRWGGLIARGDPFYNPNLTSLREDAGL